jgi:hypothetical protein
MARDKGEIRRDKQCRGLDQYKDKNEPKLTADDVDDETLDRWYCAPTGRPKRPFRKDLGEGEQGKC